MRLADSQGTWPLSASGDQIWSSGGRGTGRIEHTYQHTVPFEAATCDFVIAKTSGQSNRG